MFRWTDWNLDPGFAEFPNFSGPDAGAVDEVVALDHAVLSLDTGDIVVRRGRCLHKTKLEKTKQIINNTRLSL